MVIREYQPTDCKEILRLFYDTVHSVNLKDYAEEQLAVWATGKEDQEEWNRSLLGHYSLVAIADEIVIGFGDIDQSGYLDRLYIHRDYQRKGTASAICNKLEQTVIGKIVTHASVTARPFFEKRGYKVINEQQVERKGIVLKNYVMEKYRYNNGL
ncbi:MAG: GNAT family N-acetyltransferase [Lachnospiraceae bacterium]|nr:GNAT family N-acetyltransferase [Lachnospiraceae bacterium]